MTADSISTAPGAALHLRWEDVTFDVEDTYAQREKGAAVPIKRVLHGVTAQVAPGQVGCIMGPSGSGKTSLLNILARNNTNGVGGKVLVNGQPLPPAFKRFVGYVTQDEHLIPALTVAETVDFAAQLKLPVSTTKEERAARVSAVLKELDLERVRDSRVGVVGDGISGGERRRLAIAVEILNQPPLLLLDEPTSGLDAASALLIVKLLRRLAASLNSAVLCTVHQPRASVLRSFDSVLLLGLGRVVYFGSPDEKLVEFFGSCGYKCPPFENPADWMLDLINTKDEGGPDDADAGSGGEEDAKDNSDGDAALEAAESGAVELPRLSPAAGGGSPAKKAAAAAAGGEKRARAEVIEELSAAFAASKMCAEATAPPAKYPPALAVGGATSQYITPWTNQASVVLRRSFFHKLREPMAAMTQAFNAILMPTLVGVIFFQQDLDEQGALNRLSALSLLMILQGFFAFDTILLFPLERNIYQRENRAGLYSTSAFYVGRTAADLPFHAGFAVLTAVIFHLLVGLRGGGGHFFVFLLTIELVTLCGSSLLLLIGAVSKGFEESNLIASMSLIILMLFDGNWLPIEDIPKALRWIHHLSFMNYGVSVGIHNELSGTTFDCPAGVDTCPGGDEFLEARGFGDVVVWTDLVILLAMCIGFRVLAYLALRFMHTGRTFEENRKA